MVVRGHSGEPKFLDIVQLDRTMAYEALDVDSSSTVGTRDEDSWPSGQGNGLLNRRSERGA